MTLVIFHYSGECFSSFIIMFSIYSKKEGPGKVRCTIFLPEEEATHSICVTALASTKTTAKAAASRRILQKLEQMSDK